MYLSFLIDLFILIGELLLYNIVVIFAIHQHESATGAHVSLHPEISPPPPPPSPLHPSGLSQNTSSECPASRIKPALVIYFTYGNIHVLLLLSQITPPSSSPTESKNLFFISVSVLLPYL